MNQNLDVGERSLDPARRWRFNPLTHDPRWTGDNQRRRNVVNRRQRENGTIVIVHRCMVRTVMLKDPVRIQVAMNNDPNMSLLLGLVHVFGWGDGEQPQRGT